jgi:creatinine amidohydrolase
MAMSEAFIRYIEATPQDIKKAINKAAFAYVPLGALEWHGEHNPLGLDSIKAEFICERAAELTGGVVFPVVQWGAYDPLNFPYTFQFPRYLMRRMLESIAVQLKDMGFEIAVFLSGHYPPSQVRHLEKMSRRISKKYPGFFVLGLPEFILAGDIDYLGDHAAMWETSMMMAIDPALVHLENLPVNVNFAERAIRHGVFGRHPRMGASTGLGRLTLDTIVSRLAGLILKVDECQSLETYETALKNFYRIYHETFNPFGLKRIFRNQGITSARDGFEFFRWSLLQKGKYNPEYRYTGKK